jgi:hypothetical protein
MLLLDHASAPGWCTPRESWPAVQGISSWLLQPPLPAVLGPAALTSQPIHRNTAVTLPVLRTAGQGLSPPADGHHVQVYTLSVSGVMFSTLLFCSRVLRFFRPALANTFYNQLAKLLEKHCWNSECTVLNLQTDLRIRVSFTMLTLCMTYV